MKLWPTLTIPFLLSSVILFGQQTGYLRDKSNGRLKKLRPKTVFQFRVGRDSVKHFHQGRILTLTDSTLTIAEFRRRRSKDIPRKRVLRFDEIEYLSNPLFINNGVSEGGGWFIVGAGFVLVCTPIVWATEGEQAAKETLVFSGILVAVGGIVLLPQFIRKNFDMKEWEIVRR
jgi:hypothetical protein